MKKLSVENTVMPDVVFENYDESAKYIHEQTKK